MADTLSSAVLQVEVKHCAVRAEALLACRAAKAGEPLRARVHWSGTGNQYDIFGRSWIVFRAQQGSPTFSTAVDDLNSWSKVADTESNPIQSKLNYQIDPAKRSFQLQPRDFAITNSGSPQNQPGANPDLVGPWSNP
jgi:eukaryotic-like serine/threonine-protein kinase